MGYPENPTALATFEQSPTKHHFFMQHGFFNQTIGKQTTSVQLVFNPFSQLVPQLELYS